MSGQLIYAPNFGGGALPDSVQVRDNGAGETAVFERVVRCADCAKTDALDDGRIVCKRFGCFNHVTPPGFFCAAGERRGA